MFQNRTLLDALVHLYPDSSKTTLRSWIKEGKVKVDGSVIKISGTMIGEEQEILVDHARRHWTYTQIPIVYHDSHLVVIDKPEGMLSVATPFDTQRSAHALLKMHYRPRRVYVVHRLDQDTSGLMLFALSEAARDKLKEEFEKHTIERNYTALVEGHVEPSQGTWKSYLYEDNNYHVRSTDDAEKGKLSITHYSVEKEIDGFTWLTLRLETGKKNQIRVHCQKAGHPVAGDSKYGSTTNPLKRLALHAHRLKFLHPITGKKMQFESPVPWQTNS